MKSHFLKLLNYDSYSNLQLTELLLKANQPKKAVELMAHLIMAQQVWLSRCKGLIAPAGPLWPTWQVTQFKHLLTENTNAWIDYVNSLNEDGFDVDVTTKTLKAMSSIIRSAIY